MTPRQAADLRLRLAAERLQRANDELIAAEREHALAAHVVEIQQAICEQYRPQCPTSNPQLSSTGDENV